MSHFCGETGHLSSKKEDLGGKVDLAEAILINAGTIAKQA